MKVEEVSCGRCDRDEAGPGAESIVADGYGWIVACADCLPAIRREAERTERTREAVRRFLH